MSDGGKIVKILIVDDSILVRRCLIKLIDLIPYVKTIREATNVPEAIRLLGEFSPEIVIFDIYLPGGSGLDLLRMIQLRSPKPMAIILTGNTDQQLRTAAAEGGANYVFDKSCEYEQLLQVLRSYSASTGSEGGAPERTGGKG